MWILREFAQRGHDIATRDFHLKNFIQKLRYICLPPCPYQQNINMDIYMYIYITTTCGHELSRRVCAHAYN